MTSEIVKEIHRLEEQHEIKILYAVESGSRAWGFASKDSDWDVRFIYIHKPEWYLSIDDKKDSMEEILPNDIDLAGWEIRKALRLYRKSNPPLMEWLRSPIVYHERLGLAENLRTLSGEFFNPKSCLHHYLHMAEGNFKEYLQRERVRLKKYFYVLRPVLACEWIYRTNSMAPMEFHSLLESEIADGQLKSEIKALLSRKMAGDELNDGPVIPVLNEFLGERIAFFRSYVQQSSPPIQPNTHKLNLLFRQYLTDSWAKT